VCRAVEAEGRAGPEHVPELAGPADQIAVHGEQFLDRCPIADHHGLSEDGQFQGKCRTVASTQPPENHVAGKYEADALHQFGNTGDRRHADRFGRRCPHDTSIAVLLGTTQRYLAVPAHTRSQNNVGCTTPATIAAGVARTVSSSSSGRAIAPRERFKPCRATSGATFALSSPRYAAPK
jgi:hypothetical protein